MNQRMEQEMERTIQRLRASMPQRGCRPVPRLTPLRIAAAEISPVLLLALLAGVPALGEIGVRGLSAPMLTAFCTAPMPLLLLFHRYVLRGGGEMRELERTFYCSYAEMLAGRTAVISAYLLLLLLLLSWTLHRAAGESFFRLALCGAVPSLYLCALLLFLSSMVRSQEGIALIAAAFWAALCCLALLLPFQTLLQMCSTGLYAALAAAGAVLYGVCLHSAIARGKGYAPGIG